MAQAPARPNVLVVLLDDLRWDAPGYAGKGQVKKEFPYTPNVRGVRTAEWKYVHYPHGDGSPDRHLAELYDLRNDPGEIKNLINAPEAVPKLQELKSELAKAMAATGLTPEADRMPIDGGIKKELPDQKIR